MQDVGQRTNVIGDPSFLLSCQQNILFRPWLQQAGHEITFHILTTQLSSILHFLASLSTKVDCLEETKTEKNKKAKEKL